MRALRSEISASAFLKYPEGSVRSIIGGTKPSTVAVASPSAPRTVPEKAARKWRFFTSFRMTSVLSCVSGVTTSTPNILPSAKLRSISLNELPSGCARHFSSMDRTCPAASLTKGWGIYRKGLVIYLEEIFRLSSLYSMQYSLMPQS